MPPSPDAQSQLVLEEPHSHAHLHGGCVGLEQVDVAVLGAGQARRLVQDGFKKLFLVQAVDQAQGGRVQGRQALVLPPAGRPSRRQGAAGPPRAAPPGAAGRFVPKGSPSRRPLFHCFGVQPKRSHPSGAAVEPDGDLPAVDDHRYPAFLLGIGQHILQPVRIIHNIHVLDPATLFGIRFTSCLRVGSLLLPVNNDPVNHCLTP